MLITKAGLIGTSRYNRGSRIIGQGLSKLHSLGLVYIGSLVRRNVNVPSWHNILTYLVVY